MKPIDKARQLAQSSIYDNVELLGDWNGYRVYEPTFNDDAPRCIGFPQFILNKGTEFRWTRDFEESNEIMRKFWSSEKEDNE